MSSMQAVVAVLTVLWLLLSCLWVSESAVWSVSAKAAAAMGHPMGTPRLVVWVCVSVLSTYSVSSLSILGFSASSVSSALVSIFTTLISFSS